jgi:hypothetical protein
MGEVKVPWVGRHVRTLGKVTDVAQVALVDHCPVILFVDAINFAAFAFVNQVEQRWEGAAEAHASTTAVANVKDTLELIETGFFVIKLWVLPVDGMPGGRF